MTRWGAFQYACGYVTNVYFSHGDDLGPLRSAIERTRAKSRQNQRRWVAHLLLKQIRAGRHHQLAERDVAKAIRDLLKRSQLPPGFDARWFEILGRDKQLKSTYSRKHLSEPEIEALVSQPALGIPPTNIPTPKT